jgi:hypothetical protein
VDWVVGDATSKDGGNCKEARFFFASFNLMVSSVIS